MSQKNLIIIGFGIIAILIVTWIYLMFFAPNKIDDETFTDLGLNGEVDGTVIIEPDATTTEPVVNMDRPRLRQLTTKPVIGFTEVQATSTDPIEIFYAEAGTGHIYKINLSSGEETRVSNTTIGEAAYASFSNDGKAVAIRARNDKRANNLILGLIDETSTGIKETELKANVYDFTLVSSSTLLYTTKETSGMVAHSQNWQTGTEKSLFTIPFFEANISWGKDENSSHIVYPKPSYLLEGYLYKFTKGIMERLPASGFGLTAINTPEYIVYTTVKNYTPSNIIYNLKTKEKSLAPILVLPEKCVNDPKDPVYLWCGYEEFKKLDVDFPDNWYRGKISFSDTLWKVNLQYQNAELLVDTLKESGREIDVTNMSIGGSETALYFINKNDNTLWMYEL